MESKYTPQYLMDLLGRMMAPQEETPLSELRYVIYARKSSKGEEKQERSIKDQLDECQRLAEREGLIVKDTVTEQESAKESGQRPKFNQILENIRLKKYDGIIAWHPDRLSRNMKESGEIIDQLDKKVIKDLRFASFSFSNDVDGKVMLGIAFVLAKQYSEKLGKDIKRGLNKSILEGQMPAQTKYGYYKDEKTNLLYPDGDNFELMRKAWEMRANGKTNKVIARFLNENGLTKAVGRGQQKQRSFKMSDKKLSEIFRLPLYAGVGFHGKNIVNLLDLYDFTQMVTIEDYIRINKSWLGGSMEDQLRRARKGAILGGYLNRLVRCETCGKYLRPAPTTKKLAGGKSQIIVYLRCMNEGCASQNKSARARVVDNFVNDFLDKSEWTYTKKAYDQYKRDMRGYIDSKNKELTEALRMLKKKKTNIKERVKSLLDSYISEPEEEFKKTLKEQHKESEKALVQVENEIDMISEKIKDNNHAILSFKDFYELFKGLPLLSKNIKKLSNKDKLARILFTNLTISFDEGTGLNSKVVGFELNSPFKELYESQKFSSGGAAGN